MAEGAAEGCAVEPKEFVAVCNAPGVLLGELDGFALDGVSVGFEFCYRLWTVLDFEDPFNLAYWGLLLEPARCEDNLYDVSAAVFRS